jgi:hypothetical protein
MKIQDGDWTLFDSDIKLGRYVWARRNADGSTTYRTDYAVQPTIDQNTAQRNLAQSGWAGDYHHIASVPLNIVHDQLTEAQSQGDDAYVSKWLNSSDNSAWRVKTGRV